MKTSPLLLGATTTAGTATQTLSWQSGLFPVNEYDAMDVLIYVSAFVGTSFSVSVQERFSDVGFSETANSGTITGTGTFYLASSTEGITGTNAAIRAVDPRLGKGGEKQAQIIAAAGGTISTLACSVYLIPFSH